MTQQEFIVRVKELGLYNHQAMDFLRTWTNGNDDIQETEIYFYKPFTVGGNKELRFFKQSKRVTASKVDTENIKSHGGTISTSEVKNVLTQKVGLTDKI